MLTHIQESERKVEKKSLLNDPHEMCVELASMFVLDAYVLIHFAYPLMSSPSASHKFKMPKKAASRVRRGRE